MVSTWPQSGDVLKKFKLCCKLRALGSSIVLRDASHMGPRFSLELLVAFEPSVQPNLRILFREMFYLLGAAVPNFDKDKGCLSSRMQQGRFEDEPKLAEPLTGGASSIDIERD